MKPEEFFRSIKGGEISPLYCLYGDEPYLVDRAVKNLLERVVAKDFQDFNQTVFYGNECKGDEIVETSQTLPMFSEWRVVLVKKAGQLSASAQEKVAEYVRDPSPSTCLILQGDKFDQRKKLFLELKKNAALVEFKRLYENQLGQFIRDEIISQGKKIDAAAVEMLVYLVGNNLQELVAQMEKVVTFVGERNSIGLSDIKEIVSDTRISSVFELTNALGERSLSQALRFFSTLMRDGEAPLMVLSMITRHFRQLWRVQELMQKKMPQQEIGRVAGINPYFLKGIMDQAKKFRTAEFKQIFEKIFASDLAIKTGSGAPNYVVERLLLDICTRSKL